MGTFVLVPMSTVRPVGDRRAGLGTFHDRFGVRLQCMARVELWLSLRFIPDDGREDGRGLLPPYYGGGSRGGCSGDHRRVYGGLP
jgi:hypothetical protein